MKRRTLEEQEFEVLLIIGKSGFIKRREIMERANLKTCVNDYILKNLHVKGYIRTMQIQKPNFKLFCLSIEGFKRIYAFV